MIIAGDKPQSFPQISRCGISPRPRQLLKLGFSTLDWALGWCSHVSNIVRGHPVTGSSSERFLMISGEPHNMAPPGGFPAPTLQMGPANILQRRDGWPQLQVIHSYPNFCCLVLIRCLPYPGKIWGLEMAISHWFHRQATTWVTLHSGPCTEGFWDFKAEISLSDDMFDCWLPHFCCSNHHFQLVMGRL